MSLRPGLNRDDVFAALAKLGPVPDGVAKALNVPVDALQAEGWKDLGATAALANDYAVRLAREAARPRDEPAWTPFDNFAQALGVGRVFPDKTKQAELVFQENPKAPKQRIDFAQAVMAQAIATLRPTNPDPAYA